MFALCYKLILMCNRSEMATKKKMHICFNARMHPDVWLGIHFLSFHAVCCFWFSGRNLKELQGDLCFMSFLLFSLHIQRKHDNSQNSNIIWSFVLKQQQQYSSACSIKTSELYYMHVHKVFLQTAFLYTHKSTWYEKRYFLTCLRDYLLACMHAQPEKKCPTTKETFIPNNFYYLITSSLCSNITPENRYATESHKNRFSLSLVVISLLFLLYIVSFFFCILSSQWTQQPTQSFFFFSFFFLCSGGWCSPPLCACLFLAQLVKLSSYFFCIHLWLVLVYAGTHSFNHR